MSIALIIKEHFFNLFCLIVDMLIGKFVNSRHVNWKVGFVDRDTEMNDYRKNNSLVDLETMKSHHSD